MTGPRSAAEIIFSAQRVTYRYPRAEATAVDAVDFAIHAGELVGIVGPNGSGKTTLLRLLLGALEPTDGRIMAFGRPATEWKRAALARRVAVVVQREEPVFPLRVRQAVTLGRYPYAGPLRPLTAADHDAVDRALRRADALHLAQRWTATLSGGEWQRVRLARALAQEPDALVLDEATANLDLGHEMDAFELVADLVHAQQLTGVLVTHRVNLAARFVSRIVVLDRGRVVADGPPADVLTRTILERVFGWPVEAHPWRGIPQFIPLRRSEIPQSPGE